MPRLVSLGTATPPHRLRQEEARLEAERLLQGTDPLLLRLLSVFDNAGVASRFLARPVEWYLENPGWRERTQAFLETGLELLETATRQALHRVKLEPQALDGIVLVTSTGLSTPSLEARLANRMDLRSDLVRAPLWGLGCAGGVAGLARAADLARARPDGRFLLLSLELCSLAFLRSRLDKKMVVAASLFGDGCAAALVTGDAAADETGLRIVGSASHQWRDTEYVMGWDVRNEGLDVIFDPSIPRFVRDHIREPVHAFLNGQRADAYAMHPGGAKVLDSLQDALELPPSALDASRTILREYGNMSSPTVLFVLEQMLRQRPSAPRILLGALGPGFSSELALLEGDDAADSP